MSVINIYVLYYNSPGQFCNALNFRRSLGDTGGNSLTEDLNTQYQAVDMVWVAMSGCLVFLMIPGITIFYAELSR